MESLVLNSNPIFEDIHVPSIDEVLHPPQVVKCIIPQCSQEFSFPKDTQALLEHSLLQHCLVIAEVERVALIEDYIDYWRHKLIGLYILFNRIH